jgi:preprotein translocase subunit SecF
LVGTYSSIAIAAPILLVGGDPDKPSGGSKSAAEESRVSQKPPGQLQRA